MNRRSFLGTAAVAGLAGLAGCQSVLGGSPDPTVMNTEADRSLAEYFGGEADFHAEIENDGAEGEVQVTLDLVDADGQTLSRTRERFHFREDERRRVTVSAEVPEGTERFEMVAEPAD